MVQGVVGIIYLNSGGLYHECGMPRLCPQAWHAKGLSMKELYYSSGVSDSQICLIENGENALTERTAEKLGQVLEVGVEWLLTGNEERKNFPLEGKLAE